jgi:ElaA protein
MQLSVKTFNELTLEELYALLQLRSDIFVVEQDCVFLDPDDKDQAAIHVLGWVESELVAYARVFGPGDYFPEASIGRVAVKKEYRGKGLGIQLMQASIKAIEERFGTSHIALSAQKYLERFYHDLGFATEGEGYLEDGIPHVRMVLREDTIN